MSQLNKVTPTMRKVQPTMIHYPSPTGSGYDEEWSIKLRPGMTYHGIEFDTNLKEVPTINGCICGIVELKNAAPQLINAVRKAVKT